MIAPDTAYAYPDVVRMELAECRQCSRESPYCVSVVWRRPHGWSCPSMCCASCRVAHMRHWAVAAGWQVVEPTHEPQMSALEWEKWKAENPPLDLD